jgi:drug/metabolite transporter (DMT)-like permease
MTLSFMVCLLLTALFIILASIGHLLLKSAANSVAKSGGRLYLHPVSIAGYGIFAVATLLSIFAVKGLPLSFFFVLTSLTYISIPLLSFILLRESVSRTKLIGIVIIAIGVLLFSL